MLEYQMKVIGLLILFVMDTSLARGLTKWEKINNILSKNDFSTPPWRGKRGKSTVTMAIFFSQIRSTGVHKVEFMYNIYQTWLDTRLTYNATNPDDIVEISRRHWNKVWQPDLYPDNDISSYRQDVSNVNKLLWVLPNGTMTLGLRLTTELSCKLLTVQFPVGKSICRMKFRTFSYRQEVLRLQWKSKNAVHFASNLLKNYMKLARYKKKMCMNDRVSLVRTSCVELMLRLKIDYSSSLLQLYLPSIFVVLMAWLSFWVRRDQVAARTSLTTLCVVSMITEKMGVNFLMPEAAGVMAVEIWMFVCLTFVCGALCEFIWVHTLTGLERKSMADGGIRTPSLTDDPPSTVKLHCQNKTAQTRRSWKRRFAYCGIFLRSGQLETCAKIIYALAFGSFQIVYWTYFLLLD
ncbi:glycine receptor subunit alphaZ1-like [Ylistrum balloti]|uniref:glycine receptor subunit alphaZ1-like n=1 Tax=Ylistrum balloti TaxID=509963 RepID=UPI0029058FFB|nr:glycine receptor subunit alphaZ1-like [Ylistrum balloti]